jgi:hypothetical protein
MFGFHLVGKFWDEFKFYTWPQVSCLIKDSAIGEDNAKGKIPYFLEINLEYDYKGEKYPSVNYRFPNTSDYAKVYRLSDKYPIGSKTVCYVNPNRTSEAVLEHPGLVKVLTILIPLFFILIGSWGLYISWKKQKSKQYNTQAEKNITLLIACAIIGGSGLMLGYLLLLRPIYNVIEARSWQETPCRVVSAQLREYTSRKSGGGTTIRYKLDILYEYNFEGKKYRNNQYSFYLKHFWDYSDKQKLINYYNQKNNPICFVKPDDPYQSVLNRSIDMSILLGLISIPFLAVGLGCIYSVLKGKSKKDIPKLSSE